MKTDALLKELLKLRVEGEEDFYVFSLVIDDPDYPTHDQRFAFMGTHEQAARACVAMTHLLFERGLLKNGLRIETYHGDGARNYLAYAARQEREFQEQTQSQPHN
jgi:hypothetical protein